MPDKTHARESTNIEPDPLAEKLVPDPTKTPDVVMVRGFVGRGSQEDSVRVYLDESFTHFVEVRVSDIKYRQQLSTSQSPLGGSIVYVNARAQIQHVTVSTPTVAQFLKGEITEAYAGKISSIRAATLAKRAVAHAATHPVGACASDTRCYDCGRTPEPSFDPLVYDC